MSNSTQRNDKCPCNSGKKYKRCCGNEAVLVVKRQQEREEQRKAAQVKAIGRGAANRQTMDIHISPSKLAMAAAMAAAMALGK